MNKKSHENLIFMAFLLLKEDFPMTKIETFRWRMWHVYLLIFITILLTGTVIRYGYRIQSAYSLNDRLYDYINKKVSIKSFQNIKIGNFNVLGVKFENEKSLERSQLAVGRTYLAFQESRYKLSKYKKDSKNYILFTIISWVKILENDTLLMY